MHVGEEEVVHGQVGGSHDVGAGVVSSKPAAAANALALDPQDPWHTPEGGERISSGTAAPLTAWWEGQADGALATGRG